MNFYKKSLIGILIFCLSTNLFSQEVKTVGLIQYDSLSYNGYTLFSPLASEQTFLIDNCGQKLKEWTFSSLPGLLAYINEDGTIYRAERTVGSFGAGGSGGRIVHKTWDDELIWNYTYANDEVRQHHDFQVLPNGNVLLLAWERKTMEEAIQAGRIPSLTSSDGVWYEHIVEVKPIGVDSAEIVWEWHVFDHLVQERDPSLDNFGEATSPNRIHINYNIASIFSPSEPGNPDWMHINSLQYNELRDEIILSSRDFNEVFIIDHSTTSAEAATGKGGNSNMGGDLLFRWGNNASFNKANEEDKILFLQHHASWIENTSSENVGFTVFNNGLGSGNDELSSVEIVSPNIVNGNYTLTEDGVFLIDQHSTIVDNEELDFTSARLSSVQILNNNNILITSGNNGKIIELANQQEKVWEYIVPINNSGPITQGNNPSANDVFRAERYSVNYQAFDDKDLFPIGILEIDPDPQDCFIIDTTTSITDFLISENINIFPNPVSEFLFIETETYKDFSFELFGVDGMRYASITSNGKAHIDMHNMASGIYFLKLETDHYVKMVKVIKK